MEAFLLWTELKSAHHPFVCLWLRPQAPGPISYAGRAPGAVVSAGAEAEAPQGLQQVCDHPGCHRPLKTQTSLMSPLLSYLQNGSVESPSCCCSLIALQHTPEWFLVPPHSGSGLSASRCMVPRGCGSGEEKEEAQAASKAPSPLYAQCVQTAPATVAWPLHDHFLSI